MSLLPPLSDSLTRGAPLSVAEAEARPSPGSRRVWAALVHASRAAESVRAGPAVELGFQNCFVYSFFHRFVCMFKNVYLLVGSFK